MSAHAEEHFAGSNKLFTSIWVWLVALTLVEIFLAYRPMSIHFMLTILLGLSIIKAALIVAYFIIFNKFLGGTIWKQILRAKR